MRLFQYQERLDWINILPKDYFVACAVVSIGLALFERKDKPQPFSYPARASTILNMI